jgi:hypothetical protein
VEAKLNALPMFVTEIDGLDIQFIHVRKLTSATRHLIRRTAALACLCEQMENDLASGEKIDADVYVRSSGNLRRFLDTLGLVKERQKTSQRRSRSPRLARSWPPSFGS